MTRRKFPGKFTLTKSSNEVFTLKLREETSGIVFVEAYIQPIDMINALTGLAENPMEIEIASHEHLGRLGHIRTARTVGIPKEKIDPKIREWKHLAHSDPKRADIKRDFDTWLMSQAILIMQEEDLEDYRHGWMLHSDGSNSQQGPKIHHFTVHRYDPVEAPENEH